MTENDFIFLLLLGILLISFVSHRAYYARKFRIDEQDISTPTPSTLKTKVASALAAFGFLGSLLYIMNPSWMTCSSIMLPLWLRWSGVVIAILSFGLLQWAQITLGNNWSDEPHISSEHQLV